MVNRKATIALGLVIFSLLLLIGGYGLWNQNDPEGREVVKSTEKIIRFSYTLSNQSAEPVHPFEFISYVPVDIEGYQSIQFIQASQEYSLSGNNTANNITFDVALIPPYGSRVVSLTLGVQTLDGPEYSRIDEASYLKSEDYIEVDDPAIQRVADSLASNTADTPKRTFQWVTENIQDAGYIAQNKGARYAVQEKRGDCTEYMYAFIALARANGIPARGVAGFVIENDAAVVSSSDYHNWAEFHDGEKWILVDPYKGVFDDKYGSYVAFRLIGGKESGSNSVSRFMAVDDRVSVRL